MPKNELFLGNLGRDVTRKDIETVFDKYGRLLRCDIKDKGDLLLILFRKKKKIFFNFFHKLFLKTK